MAFNQIQNQENVFLQNLPQPFSGNAYHKFLNYRPYSSLAKIFLSLFFAAIFFSSLSCASIGFYLFLVGIDTFIVQVVQNLDRPSFLC